MSGIISPEAPKLGELWMRILLNQNCYTCVHTDIPTVFELMAPTCQTLRERERKRERERERELGFRF